MDRQQRARFEQALEREREIARRRVGNGGRTAAGGAFDAPVRGMVEPDRPRPVVDPRAKNSGHGQKTADKWNQ